MAPQQIDQRYQIIRPLGSGVTGQTFLVENNQEDEQEKLKVVKLLKTWQPHLSPEKARTHFNHFYLMLQGLHHPGLAQVLDYGFDPEVERYFIVTEYFEARDLFTATIGWTPWIIEELMVQILRVLEYLHSRGFSHLNLKPTNLLVTPDKRLKITDLDLMRQCRTHYPQGDPAYSAPEIIYNLDPDGRADLYALGVLFYYCLSRTHPFMESTAEATLSKQIHFTPLPINQVKTIVPNYLHHIITNLLEKSRTHRYPSASHVIRDLNIVSGHSYPLETPDTPLVQLPEEGPWMANESALNYVQNFSRSLLNPETDFYRKTLWVKGSLGTGKTRFLKELQFQALTQGINTVSVQIGHPLLPISQPTIFLLDDVQNWSLTNENHWKDYLHKIPSVPYLCVITSTPDCHNPLPLAQPLMTSSTFETLNLHLLSHEIMTQFITSLTGIKEPPHAWSRFLYDRAQGHPLLTKEWLALLLQKNVLLDTQGDWRELPLEEIEAELQTLMEKGLTLLDVIHQRFLATPKSLQRILKQVAESETPLSLDQCERAQILKLVQAGWIRRHNTSQTFRLAHPLYQEAIMGASETLEPSSQDTLKDTLRGLSQNLQKDSGQFEDLLKIGQIGLHLEDLSVAEQAYAKAQAWLKTKTVTDEGRLSLAQAYQGLAAAYHHKQDAKKAVGHYKSALALAENLHDALLITSIKGHMAPLEILPTPPLVEIHPAPATPSTSDTDVAELTQKLNATLHQNQELQIQMDQLQGQLEVARSLIEDRSPQTEKNQSWARFITRSPAMKTLIKTLKKVAPTTLPILMTSENGIATDLYVRTLHQQSRRHNQNLLTLTCSTIPEGDFEKILFGHYARPGVVGSQSDIGLLAKAAKGSLWIDDIEALPLEIQKNILTTLKDLKETQRARLIVTSAKDIKLLARLGKFHDPLYQYISAIEVTLPPLRQRLEDLPELLHQGLRAYQLEHEDPKTYTLEKRLVKRLLDYSWPENEIELSNFIRVACALSEHHVLNARSLPAHSPLATTTTPRLQSASKKAPPVGHYSGQKTWSDFEKTIITHAYRHHKFKALPTAKALGISPPTVYRKIKEWHLADSNNPLYEDPFDYSPRQTLKEVRHKIFQDALDFHKRPYAALRALGVSQGFFYKVIKETYYGKS
jgi:DNA-binding NtrC family response regulator/serine/threonine protein kinase